MVLLDSLWHPDNARATKDLDICLGVQPWSPDGRLLSGWSPDSQGLSLVTLATGDLTLLETTACTGCVPSWSPDGRYLTYYSYVNRPGSRPLKLALYDLEAQEESFLSKPIDDLKLIDLIGWSFDSNRVAYTEWITSAEGVLVTSVQIVDIHTKADTQLVGSSSESFLQGCWSPSQDQILLLGEPGLPPGIPSGGQEMYVQSTIYLYDLRTNQVEEIKGPSGLYVNGRPWSPDGNKIIYSDQGVICTLTIDTQEEGCPTEISEAVAETGSVGAFYPTWSPSGEWIAFVLKFDSQYCSPLAVIRPDGSDLRFTDAESGDCSVSGPVWSPRQ